MDVNTPSEDSASARPDHAPELDTIFEALSEDHFPNRELPREEESEFPRLITDECLRIMVDEHKRMMNHLQWIELEQFEQLSAADMIVTILHKRNPNLLKLFLDPESGNVEYFWESAPDNGCFYIKKTYSSVRVSYISILNER